MERQLLYQRIAHHYRGAIESGALRPGAAMPSIRSLTRLHRVSLSTALQACRSLEEEGLLEARPRSGYFVLTPRRASIPPVDEPDSKLLPDATQYVGIHDRVSTYVAMRELHEVQIDFGGSYASPDAYPGTELKNAAIRALRAEPDLLARKNDLKGEPRLRAALARRALDAGTNVSPDDIVITHGCTEALNVAVRAVTQRGDRVAVESPTWHGLLQVIESLGLRALEIPTSPISGMSVDALAFALQTYPDLKAVLVVPNLQNPLGCVMPDAEKARLVALCEQHALPLIEDDTYAALGADDAPLRALKSFDTTGNVIHCASLRKTLAPGTRLGWISGGKWQARVEMLRYTQSRANEPLSQLAVADFLASSAHERHLVRLRRLLKRQCEQTAEAIAQHFPAGTRLSMPSGGMFLWVELPQKESAQSVFETALARGVRVVPGSLFSNSNRFDHFIRISCGTPFTREANEGLKTLGQIVAAGG